MGSNAEIRQRMETYRNVLLALVWIGAIAGMIGGFINGAGFTALDGGNFDDIMNGGIKGAAVGAGTGAIGGGIFGGVKSLIDGKNVWSGNDIAQGRSAFSFKNTPVEKLNIQQVEGTIPSEIKKYMTPEKIAEIESQTTNYNNLVKDAQKLYPNKAGVTELHHIEPQYIGGPKNGLRVPLNGSYHQVITNEFRGLQPYGFGPIKDPAIRWDIMNQVYTKYPLPPGFKY